MKLVDFHFITDDPWREQAQVEVSFKIRHTDKRQPSTLYREQCGYRLISKYPLQGIAPGQFGVIYDAVGKLCIGSGEIYSP